MAQTVETVDLQPRRLFFESDFLAIYPGSSRAAYP